MRLVIAIIAAYIAFSFPFTALALAQEPEIQEQILNEIKELKRMVAERLPLAETNFADTVLHNAKVLTVDENFAIAEAIAVSEGKITAVGTNDEILTLAGPNTLRIDLKGRTVIPGLIDTHSHVQSYGQRHYIAELGHANLHEYPLDWGLVRNKEDLLKQIKEYIDRLKFEPGEWIYFSGVNLSGMGYGSESVQQFKMVFDELTRWDLDRVTPVNPVALYMGSPTNNGYLVNSKAIDILWAKYGDFIEKYGRYWKAADGRPTGILEPPASRFILHEFLPKPSPANLASVYKKELEEWVAMGVTTISTWMDAHDVESYRILEDKGELLPRLAYGRRELFGMPDPGATFKRMGNQIGMGSEKLWMVSITAQAVDGAGARGCTNLRRIKEWDPIGAWWPQGQCHLDVEYRGARGNYFKEWLFELRRNGLRLASVHVMGDRSVELLLDIFEEIDEEMPLAGERWAIDHCTLVNPQDIARAARLDIIWSCAPKYIESVAPVADEVYGSEVAHNFVVPVKSMLDGGLKVVFEMDRHGYVWRDLELLVTRKVRGKVYGAHERLDRTTVLKMITRWAAEYVLREDLLGSIEAGKLADLVVLDRDYMTIDEEEISDLRALMTMLAGDFVYVNPLFSRAYQLRPPGAVIATYEELAARR
ncbi:amidohydrolase [Acidobacteria bacterium AH-259-D05]|nr:amidohydrolase [Acidobacteria bacterium AH-259-D05]